MSSVFPGTEVASWADDAVHTPAYAWSAPLHFTNIHDAACDHGDSVGSPCSGEQQSCGPRHSASEAPCFAQYAHGFPHFISVHTTGCTTRCGVSWLAFVCLGFGSVGMKGTLLQLLQYVNSFQVRQLQLRVRPGLRRRLVQRGRGGELHPAVARPGRRHGTKVRPSPETHASWAQLTAGDAVDQDDSWCQISVFERHIAKTLF